MKEGFFSRLLGISGLGNNILIGSKVLILYNFLLMSDSSIYTYEGIDLTPYLKDRGLQSIPSYSPVFPVSFCNTTNLIYGQRDDKFCSLPWRTFYCNAAVMSLDNLTTDC